MVERLVCCGAVHFGLVASDRRLAAESVARPDPTAPVVRRLSQPVRGLCGTTSGLPNTSAIICAQKRTPAEPPV